MMQKNLSCRNIGEAQKNMFTFSIVLVFVNLMFLFLGAVLYIYSSNHGIDLPSRTDDLFPMIAIKYLGPLAGLVFIIGFSLELAVLFTVGLAAAPFLQSEYMVYVVAAICILLGLHFMDLFHFQLPISQDKLPQYTGFIGAALFGFMFGLVSLPCTGPALILIVSVIPVKGAFFGGLMMLFYGIGHCLLILVVGTSAGAARHLIGSARMHSANLKLKRAAGALLTGVGVYIGVSTMFPGLGLGM
jgi:cytochrome c biogenesis protein CcdA